MHTILNNSKEEGQIFVGQWCRSSVQQGDSFVKVFRTTSITAALALCNYLNGGNDLRWVDLMSDDTTMVIAGSEVEAI